MSAPSKMGDVQRKAKKFKEKHKEKGKDSGKRQHQREVDLWKDNKPREVQREKEGER